MKKTILRILIVVLGLLALYTVFNQFDSAPPELKYLELREIKNPVYDSNNSYFRLWTLPEPKGTDIESKELHMNYRRLFDPQFDTDQEIIDFDEAGYKAMAEKTFVKRWREILGPDASWLNIPKNTSLDWCQQVLANRDTVTVLEKEFGFLQERFQKFIETEMFQDLTIIRMDIPIPHLLTYLGQAKLYVIRSMLTALDGDWLNGTNQLLDLVDSSKKVMRGSRTLITNLVAKAIIRISCEAMASLINNAECPPEVYQLILDRTPPLAFEEYGSVPMVFEYQFRPPYNWKRFMNEPDYGFFKSLFFGLFTQQNRTLRLRDQSILPIIEAERIPPYQWTYDPFKPESPIKGMFWWLQNPGGKLHIHHFVHKGGKNLAVVILKSNRVKTTYQILRISAELHKEFNPNQPVQKILNRLETYKVPDPCSGKPYVWNNQKQILYSIGTDRKDDGGEPQGKDEFGDFPLPVTLYVK